jgi:hypothetical protein
VILRWRRRRFDPFYWKLTGEGFTRPLGIVQTSHDICPFCYAEVDVEYVDVGFGDGRNRGVQGTPMQCPVCESYETAKGVWEETEIAKHMPKREVQFVGLIYREAHGVSFFDEHYRTVAVGKNPKHIRRRVWDAVVEDLAVKVERGLTG